LEELQLTLTPSRVDQRNHGIMLANWRVGQTINALVSDRMPSGGLLLTVGRQSFVTTRDIPVQPGARIMLEVQQVEPKLVLRLVSAPVPGLGTINSDSVIGGGAAQANQPTGQGLSQLMAALTAASSSRSVASQLNFQNYARLLASNFLSAGAITADTFRAAFLLSGIFTESLLSADRSTQAARSTKTILLAIRGSIASAMHGSGLTAEERAALSRLLGNIDALIGSMTNHQISSIPQDGTPPRWVSSLPLQWGEKLIEIEIEIQHRPSTENEESPGWQLSLRFELDALGAISIFIGMRGNRLTVDILSSEEGSTQYFVESMPALKNQLVMAGLEVNRITAETVSKSEQTSKRDAKSINVSA
jgi:hypothetical protein